MVTDCAGITEVVSKPSRNTKNPQKTARRRTELPIKFLLFICLGFISCILWFNAAMSYTCRGNSSIQYFNDDMDSNFTKSPYQTSYKGDMDVVIPFHISEDTVILGKDNLKDDRRRFLTIGIPSVSRKEDYLIETIDGILDKTTLQEKNNILIFIMLADADIEIRSQRAINLNARYGEAIRDGLIRVLQPPSANVNINISATRITYNDSTARFRWRVKQVLDFAFLFWYVWRNQPSDYYLILEDDVEVAQNFVNAAKAFVELHQNNQWISLKLADFYTIGSLLRTHDLNHLASFLILFHKELPADLIFKEWVALRNAGRTSKDNLIRRVPGLFQHIGTTSSLEGKTQPTKDETFSMAEKKFAHKNPAAKVFTTMIQYKIYEASLAYSSSPGLFWGIAFQDDTFDIVFMNPLKISRVLIYTGSYMNGKFKDYIQSGILEVSPKFLGQETPGQASCENFRKVNDFISGTMNVEHLQDLFPLGIQCIRITIGPWQTSWIIISEVIVLTEDENQVLKETHIIP